MKHKKALILAAASICALLGTKAQADAQTAPSMVEIAASKVPDRLGVCHVSSRYHLTQGDILNEGAERVLELGSRVIKVWFMRPENSYKWNSQWPKVNSLVELAQTPYFRALFARPFTTFVLEAYSFGKDDHYWKRGMSEDDVADETRQFEELTRYLLEAYRGTSKTFVLQHWEGDWAIRSGYDPKEVPSQAAINGMIRWLNARQDGVDRARDAVRAAKVNVYHAAEVNLVADAMDGKTSVTNDVLPHTHCDLYAYSAYDTSIENKRFRAALDYIAAKAPDSATFGSKNVYIGEFGVPENDFGTEKATSSVRQSIREALDWGCPYLLYWQMFDNECKEGKSDEKGDCRGFWLFKPSGQKSPLWEVLHSFLAPPQRP